MLKAWIDFITSIFDAIRKFIKASNDEKKSDQEQIQQHIQEEYHKIDQDNSQIKPDTTIDEIQSKLNERF